MGCMEEKVVAKLEREADIEAFCGSWRNILGEGGFLAFYDEDFDLEGEFSEQDGQYVFEIEGEPLFSDPQGGDQIRLFVLGFAEKNPDAQFDIEYISTYDSSSDAVLDSYHYSGGKLSVRRAYSEYGLGDTCDECDAEFEDYLIRIDPDDEDYEYVCPECGEAIEYSARIEKYELTFADGKWDNPEGFNIEKAEKNPGMDIYMTNMIKPEITNAWKYEDELDAQGFLPEEPHGLAAWNQLTRVRKKAEEGDAKASKILADYISVNGSV